MLLPPETGPLRDDLGQLLKLCRMGAFAELSPEQRADGEEKGFGSQADVAQRVGVTRQTISDIETGRKWPGPSTLDALMEMYGLAWEHVTHPIIGVEPPDINDMPGGARLAPKAAPKRNRAPRGTPENDALREFGQKIKAGRRIAGETLAQTAAQAGISVALLSRLERGEISRPGVVRLEYIVVHAVRVPKLTIVNRKLKQLWDLG
jgi:Predicted transcriptional regulators